MNAIKHKLSIFTASVLLGLAILAPGVSAQSDIPQASSYDDPTTTCRANGGKITEENCGIIKLISEIASVLAAIAAVVIVGMIVWGGIQYSAAGADASKVQAAKSKITNALIALLLLIFGWSIIQWLIPGGALNGFGYYY